MRAIAIDHAHTTHPPNMAGSLKFSNPVLATTMEIERVKSATWGCEIREDVFKRWSQGEMITYPGNIG